MPYQKNNIEYPSVTTVLSVLRKEGLLPWVANCTAEALKESLCCLMSADGEAKSSTAISTENLRNRLINNHVLDGMLTEAKNAYKNKSAEALTIGMIIHAAIEEYIKAQLVNPRATRKSSALRCFTEKDFIRICHSLTKQGKKLSFTFENFKTSNDLLQAGLVQDVFYTTRQMFLSFLNWVGEQNVRWQASEKLLFNEEAGYAGTCDALAYLGNQLYLLDFKTSRSVYEEYRLQLAAYKAAYLIELGIAVEDKWSLDCQDQINQRVKNLSESKNVEIPKIAILLFSKDNGELQFYNVDKDWDRYYSAFVKLIDYYYLIKKRRLRHNPFVFSTRPKDHQLV